jgi:2'-hydroxyisoflavone reductase
VRILVIGGTQFVGRAVVEDAARRGHEVSVFHRGNTEPDDLPDVEHIHGDRDGGLAVLEGRTWDAAVDTSAYFPRAVRELAGVLRGAIDHFTFVSTISTYPDDTPGPVTEETPVRQPPFPDTEAVDFETYGPLKVACEQEATGAFARCLIVRPGYVIGPHDGTERFTAYVRRAAAGGEMLAPGPPEAPLQVVDARDLGAFIVRQIDTGSTGVFGVVGPSEPATLGDVLETAVEVGGAGTSLTWVSPEFLRDQLGDATAWMVPMWHPEGPGLMRFDSRKARAAGLNNRPLAETIADILAWDRARGTPPIGVGLAVEKERELLDVWKRRA